MTRMIGSMLAVTVLCGAAFSLGDKYSHPNYQIENSRARHRAKSLNGVQVAGAKPITNNHLHKDLTRLEAQTAATQAHTAAKPVFKAGTLTKNATVETDKNKPINFQYVAPKNGTLRNTGPATPQARKLIKPRYR